MEPTKEPVVERVVFVAYMTVGYCDDVTFTVAGRVYFESNHGFKAGDIVRVTIEKKQ